MHAGIIHMCAHEHARECHTHACLNVYVCAGVLFAAGLPVPPVMLMCFLLMRRIRQVPSPGAPLFLGHSQSTIHIRALRCTLRLRRTRHVSSPGHVVCHTLVHKRAECASCTMLPCDLPAFSVSRTRARAHRRHIDYEASIWASFSKWALIVQVPACPRRAPCWCILARVGQCTRHDVIISCLDALDRQIAPKGHGNQRPTWRLI